MTSYYSNNSKMDLYPHSTIQNAGRRKVKGYSYNTMDRIGKGFSSIVYKGINDRTNEVIAIKAIDMKGVKDSISKEMLECQIEALMTLKHENVLKCFDVVKEASHCYIITEFCNQGDLSGLLKKKRKLTESETMKILRDVVLGFIEIGEKGFLHRDLKLANIFMSGDKAKIADFGFAKKNKFNSEKERYNVGSPLYMSPEALKKNVYSLKNDIWSIGVMAFELLHGETPWECKTEKQLIEKMIRLPVKFKDSLKLSESMKSFIKKCLEVDERKRMSLEDLKNWISKGSVVQPAREPLGVSLKENNLPKLNLNHKPNTTYDKLSYNKETPSNKQVTGRNSARSHHIPNKQNMSNRNSALIPLPKQTVEKNNNLMVNQINSFRLMFKIFQKIQKRFPQETDMLRTLGQQVIRRVTNLKMCCDNAKEEYGLTMTDRYFDERSNPGIKKYKSVVGQYYKKYKSEVPFDLSSTPPTSIKEDIKKFLAKTSRIFSSEQDLLIGFWMIQLTEITRQTSKEKLDSIIEPKIKLTKSYIDQRVKQIM